MVLQVVTDVNDFLTNIEKLSQQLVVGGCGGEAPSTCRYGQTALAIGV